MYGNICQGGEWGGEDQCQVGRDTKDATKHPTTQEAPGTKCQWCQG